MIELNMIEEGGYEECDSYSYCLYNLRLRKESFAHK